MIKYSQYSNTNRLDSQDGCQVIPRWVACSAWTRHEGVIHVPGRMDDMGVNHQYALDEEWDCVMPLWTALWNLGNIYFRSFPSSIIEMWLIRAVEMADWGTSLTAPSSAARPVRGFLHSLFLCGLLPFPSCLPCWRLTWLVDRLGSFIFTGLHVKGSLAALLIVCPALFKGSNGCHADDPRFCVWAPTSGNVSNKWWEQFQKDDQRHFKGVSVEGVCCHDKDLDKHLLKKEKGYWA